VPTGNFGNIYAGWSTRRMGLPVGKLCIGSNRNDILTRFFETGEMKLEGVQPSLSPSMDIQVSSNFERYLCEALDRDHDALKKLMEDFRTKGSFKVSKDLHEKMRADFSAVRCDDAQTLAVMKDCFRETGIIIDPHTAVGLHAAKAAMRDDPATPMVVLACAHPAKFPDAVQKAIGAPAPVPSRLAAVMSKAEHLMALPNDYAKLTHYVRSNVKGG
jgi:threonine synthase